MWHRAQLLVWDLRHARGPVVVVGVVVVVVAAVAHPMAFLTAQRPGLTRCSLRGWGSPDGVSHGAEAGAHPMLSQRRWLTRWRFSRRRGRGSPDVLSEAGAHPMAFLSAQRLPVGMETSMLVPQ